MNRKKALTLVEMLVVMGMFGVLAGALLPALYSARGKARMVVCAHNLQQIQHGMHLYYLMHTYYPIDSHENTFGRLGDSQTSHLWSGSLQSKRGLGLMIPSFIEDPSIFFEDESNWARSVGPSGWTGEDGSTHWQNPAENVMSSYTYRQNAGKRTVKEEASSQYALVTEYTQVNSRRYNHGGKGAHILFGDGRVVWFPAENGADDMLRFDWFNLAAINPGTGESGWESLLDPMAGR